MKTSDTAAENTTLIRISRARLGSLSRKLEARFPGSRVYAHFPIPGKRAARMRGILKTPVGTPVADVFAAFKLETPNR